MLVNIVFCVVGALFGYLAYDMKIRKRKGLRSLISAVNKNRPIIFLETKTTTYVQSIIKTFHNIGITENKELVIIPPSTLKICPSLRVQVGHGDLYRSILVPSEVPKFRDMLAKEHGWSNDEIADFFEKIMTIPSSDLKKMLDNDEVKNTLDVTVKDLKKKQTKYDIYKLVPSTVQDFIYTGLNRVSIFDMLKNLVDQRELDKLGQKNWVAIAIAFFVILMGIGVVVSLVMPAIGPFLSSQTDIAGSVIPPQRIG